jgi:hypothetical protein
VENITPLNRKCRIGVPKVLQVGKDFRERIIMKPGENFTGITQVQQLEHMGFSNDEIADLSRVKALYLGGVYNEKTFESKRLEFARWLYRQGLLNEGYL